MKSRLRKLQILDRAALQNIVVTDTSKSKIGTI